MSDSDLLCIAVPGGRLVGGKATLRAVLVPRLISETKQTLADHGMVNWPAAIRAARFVVETSPVPDDVRAAELASERSDTLQDTLWPKLFPASMRVKGTSSLQGDEVPAVQLTSRQASAIARGYKQLSVALNPPTANPNLAREHLNQLATELTAIDQAFVIAASDQGFNEAREAPDHEEFHYRLTLLREHPEILKALGFIVELKVALPAAMRSGLVRIRCEGGLGFPPDLTGNVVSPWTQFQLDDQYFLPAPLSGNDFERGMVDLSDARIVDPDPHTPAELTSKWLVATFDVASGAAGLRGTNAPGDDQPIAPSLRSAGIMLLKCNRQQSFHIRISRAASNARASLRNHVLGAEDLILGYRVDVRPESGQWVSVCKRRASYEIAGEMVRGQPFIEEGAIKELSSAKLDGGPLQTNEIVVRWNGWSLAVPQPVFTELGERPPIPRGTATPFFDKVNMEVPTTANGGTLPKLRFGNSYFLRCRLADIAGGGRNCEDDLDSDESATQRLVYRRVNPVPAPIVAVDNRVGGDALQANAYGPCGHIDCLVVRSDPAALNSAEWENESRDYPANDTRQLFPPPISMELADHHGVFDDMPAEESWALVKRAMSPIEIDETGQYSWLADPTANGVQITAIEAPGMAELHPLRESAWAVDYREKRIVLKAGQSSSTMEWDTSDKTVSVTLRPGEEVMLAVSSHVLSTNFNLFEISTWLTGAATIDNRHPLLAPPRLLRLVHAVKRPLSKPGGALGAVRPIGATYADIYTDLTVTGTEERPSVRPSRLIDTASTIQIDVTAKWQEFTDDQGADRSGFVGTIICDRGDTVLQALKHEFGDTKHRRVKYVLTAISRYMEFFNIPTDENGTQILDAFKRTSDPIEVSVPSSARPAPPVVLSMAPSLRWEGTPNLPDGGTLVRKRTAGMRIELATPWNVSGEGECLAVLLPIQPSAQEVPNNLVNFVSWLHRDPIWVTDAHSALLRPDDFEGDKMDAAMVELAYNDDNAPSNPKVIALPYRVKFDGAGESKSCYVDIELPQRAEESYCPMVKLVVARYQPESLAGIELSQAVTTDFVQLMPSRTLTVQRQGGGLSVLLTGRGPDGPAPNRVIAHLERYIGAIDESSVISDLAVDDTIDVSGWQRIASSRVEGNLNEALEMAVPADSSLLRLVVREIEQFKMPLITDTENALGRDLRQRTVFLDVLMMS